MVGCIGICLDKLELFVRNISCNGFEFGVTTLILM